MAKSRPTTRLLAIDEGVLIQRTQDTQPILEDVKARRDQGLVGSKDMRHVARIPTVLVEQAAEEAGVSLEDRPAVRELIYNKITSGEWAKFMVHEGGY